MTATLSIQAHPGAEVLSLDWNKYKPLTIHTSSNDRTIKTFDTRFPTSPRSTLHGHTLAVRKIATSPHQGNLLASASYDMTVRMWDVDRSKCVGIWDGHREFAYGVEWSLFGEGWVGSVGWDGKVFVSDWAREWKKV
jgi:peroxin-7